MAKRKEIDDEIKNLKTKVQDGKAVIGTQEVLHALKNKTIGTVYIAKNCPAKARDDLMYYANLAGITCIELEYTNEELGILCKKNFFISVLGTNA